MAEEKIVTLVYDVIVDAEAENPEAEARRKALVDEDLVRNPSKTVVRTEEEWQEHLDSSDSNII